MTYTRQAAHEQYLTKGSRGGTRKEHIKRQIGVFIRVTCTSSEDVWLSQGDVNVLGLEGRALGGECSFDGVCYFFHAYMKTIKINLSAAHFYTAVNKFDIQKAERTTFWKDG